MSNREEGPARASTDEGLFHPPVRSRRRSIVGTKHGRKPPEAQSLVPAADEEDPSLSLEALAEVKSISLPPQNSRKPSIGMSPPRREPSFVRPSRKESLAKYVQAGPATMTAETNPPPIMKNDNPPPSMSPSRPAPPVVQQTDNNGQQQQQQQQQPPPNPYGGYGHEQQPNPYGGYYPPPPPQQQHYEYPYLPPPPPPPPPYGYGYPPPPPPPPHYGYPPQPSAYYPPQPSAYPPPATAPPRNDNSDFDLEASQALVQMQKTIDTKPVVLFAEDASDGAGRSRVVKKILSNLGVDAQHDLFVYTLDNRSDGHTLAQKLARMTGYDKVPLLFIAGKCFGDYQAILAQCRNDRLRPKLLDAGISGVVSAIPTTTLEDNIFGYPKALAVGQQGETASTMNLLIGCAGSSASDKIPELVERSVQQGWCVKLICTNSGEHFFKAFGMERVVNAIGAENIYRDEDEWNFEYERFDMPVRACHLALRKWADVLLVAPVTCNSMAKAAAGIGDNLLTSVFVAWEYHKKPALFCPACNADMWKNSPTQRNVKTLKGMGVEILGPRVARLTNGQVAIGAMELVDDIITRLKEKETTLLSGTGFFFSRAKLAQLEVSSDMWDLVLRGIQEEAIDINAQMEGNGNTLLHLAAGGESFEENGSITWGAPNLGALRKLIDMGAKLNIANNFQFQPLHVAISCDDVEAVTLLLEAGADATGTLIDFPSVSMQVRSILETKKEASRLVTPYYFTYGSLKRGFPNHEDLAKHLMNFTGPATTVKPYPLVIPHEPACHNPNCPYLHQQATLCNVEGKGVPVKGEVFEVTTDDIKKFDELEGFAGGNILRNVYTRAIINVQLEGKGTVKAYVYFTSASDDAMQLVETGKGRFIGEYLMDMARGDLKPGYSAKKIEKNLKRSNSLRKTIKMSQSFRKTSITPGQPQKKQSALVGVPESNSLKMSISDLDDIDTVMDNNDSQMAPTQMVPPRMRAPLRKSTIVHRHVTENIGSIQQAINTCNIAAIVMALKSLGITCSMDEIFSSLKLPTSWVVEEGLTLAQVYHVLTKLCGSSDPRESLASGLNTECYHFDEGVAKFSSFVAFLTESISVSENILIANFNTKIAKDMPNGGGHFSCIAGFKPSTQTVTIADVHPLKYGEKWSCTARQLFDSMVDRDGSVKRARGMIRLSLRSAPPIDHMKECKQAVSFYDRKYSDEMKDWLSRWGDLPAAAYESHLNMGGLSGLGLLLSGFLAGEDFDSLNLPGHVSADFLTWSLHLSVIDLLSGLVSPLTLMNYARRACEKLDIDLNITTEVADTTSPDDVYTWFDNRIGPSHSAAALVLLDINEAFGTNLRKTDVGSEAAVLDHGAQHWCCIVATSKNNEVIIADPCAAMMTRLWKCNTSRLRSALLRAEKDPGRVIILGNVPMENSMV